VDIGLVTIVLLLVTIVVVVGFGRSIWRMSEEDYHRNQARRAEDEDPDAVDDRGAPWSSYWGGWGRPGS
jgi:hypothetical protein